MINGVIASARLINAKYAIGTDGDKWKMWLVSGGTEHPLMELDLTQQPAFENALQALAMWMPNLSTGSRPSKAVRPVLISSTPPDVPPIDEPSAALQGENHVLTVERNDKLIT